MKWEKKGLVFIPDGSFDWSVSHAQLPVADIGNKDFWRIYYSTRNSLGQSTISYIHVRPGAPEEILYVHPQPILPFGELGTFDESGLMPVAVLRSGSRTYLYYAGWSLKKTVPYHNTIGLAVSDDNGATFSKFGEGPVFDSTPFEPYSNGTANILVENGIWKAWYQSITKWVMANGRPEPFYNIKYAESRDGIHWVRKARVAIDFKNPEEAGICSASVIRDGDIYKMWYCYRNKGDYRNDKTCSYRIGFAESPDGINWVRKDEQAGIDISADGWDSEMIAYPNVFGFNKSKYMFFNGNGFGRSGFGYAVSN